MSLVAYDASSDDESDYENTEGSKAIIYTTPAAKAPLLLQSTNAISNGNISDEDDEFISAPSHSTSTITKFLPKPKNDTNLSKVFDRLETPSFSVLPTPKTHTTQVDIEEDDEFLHKKPIEGIIEVPKKEVEYKRMPVKIAIPSLSNFKDVDKEIMDKAKNKGSTAHGNSSTKSSGLLGILPQAKSEQNFSKVLNKPSDINSKQKMLAATNAESPKPCFVPDTVKHRRPATNTEDVDRLKPTKKKLAKQENEISAKKDKKAESDESDDDISGNIGDFFSFNSDQSLPNVSATEIEALVAKKAAKIAESTTNYLKAYESQKPDEYVDKMQRDVQDIEPPTKRNHQDNELNSEALQALVGGSTNRRRQKQADIQVIDINSSEVLPNKDEWMRTVLASSTTYQPTGVLVDEEPASGTRRKHQITYLAHKAKANEAELQAMWSANRQNRRATQSKYGF